MKKKPNILIVDDEKQLTLSIVEFLEDDFGTHGVFSVEDAIDYLGKNDVDLIITDVKLPGKDGFDLLLWGRENKPETKILMMTAYGSPELKKKAKKNGAILYTEKPLDLSQLRRILKKIFRKKSGMASLDDLELADVLQFLSFHDKEIVLMVDKPGGKRGHLGIKGDLIVWAKTDNLGGEDAFREIMQWRGASFTSTNFYNLESGRIEKKLRELLSGTPKKDKGKKTKKAERPKGVAGDSDPVKPDVPQGEIDSFEMANSDAGEKRNELEVEAGNSKKQDKTDQVMEGDDGIIGTKEIGEFGDNNKIESNAKIDMDKEKIGKGRAAMSVTTLESLVEKFQNDLSGFVFTAIANYENGLMLAASETTGMNAETASAVYTEVIKQSMKAVDYLGGIKELGELEDILITQEFVYILLKMIGENHFQILVLSTDKGNLGLAKIIMKNYEMMFLEALKELGEL